MGLVSTNDWTRNNNKDNVSIILEDAAIITSSLSVTPALEWQSHVVS